MRSYGFKRRRVALPLTPHDNWEKFFRKLERGKVLQGRILWKLSEGKWIIRLSGYNLIAQSEIEFSDGEPVTVRVESSGPPVVIALCEIEKRNDDIIGRILERLKLPDNETWRTIVRKVLKRSPPCQPRANVVA